MTTTIDIAYAEGYHDGVTFAEYDVEQGLGVTSNEIVRARDEAQAAMSAARRARWLGFARGYREIVRSLKAERWGV